MTPDRPKILGLTIHSPWAELVARGLKPIENRTWPPPSWMCGRYVAIHASPRWDQEGADFIERNRNRFQLSAPAWNECKHGIVAVARLVGWVQLVEIIGRDPQAKTLAMMNGHDFKDEDWRWLFGPYGLVLRDVVRINPVPCRGQQKFWYLRPDVYDLVKRRYRRAA